MALRRFLTATLVSALVFTVCLAAPEYKFSDYAKSEVRITARDGVELYTVIYAPKNATEKLPVLLLRTPYSADNQGLDTRYKGALMRSGYIFAFQDIRGHYKSGGKFVMTRPMRDPRDKKAIDEATDAYDTVDWLVKNLPNNNGKVGMFGISYDGWTALIAGIDPHPALKAISPQASPVDMWVNDDFHRNGAFRLSYGFEYSYAMEQGTEWKSYPFGDVDVYDWYLKLGGLSSVNANYFHDKIPTWNDFADHPNHDDFWISRAATEWMKSPKVAMLIVAGWWDQEDPQGPELSYRLLSQNDPKNLVHLVVGPWNHGGWSGNGTKLGPLDFGSDTAAYFRDNLQAPFFAYYLKGQGKEIPLSTTFDTGTNSWQSSKAWPYSQGYHAIYLREGKALSPKAPTGNGSAAYVSDPANPVPYRPRPIEPTYAKGSKWSVWQVLDQSFASRRSDVLTFQTPPVDRPTTLDGEATAHLYASTSGTDCDWVVKLIDVYPAKFPQKPEMAGYQLMIAGEVVRARFRESDQNPKAVASGKPLLYNVPLHWIHHTFLPGHRLMVQIQSSWFPVIDRNPQKFVPNIFKAQAADYIPATQRIYFSKTMPSSIDLPILDSTF